LDGGGSVDLTKWILTFSKCLWDRQRARLKNFNFAYV